MKKILLSLGAIISVPAASITFIACGNTETRMILNKQQEEDLLNFKPTPKNFYLNNKLENVVLGALGEDLQFILKYLDMEIEYQSKINGGNWIMQTKDSLITKDTKYKIRLSFTPKTKTSWSDMGTEAKKTQWSNEVDSIERKNFDRTSSEIPMTELEVLNYKPEILRPISGYGLQRKKDVKADDPKTLKYIKWEYQWEKTDPSNKNNIWFPIDTDIHGGTTAVANEGWKYRLTTKAKPINGYVWSNESNDSLKVINVIESELAMGVISKLLIRPGISGYPIDPVTISFDLSVPEIDKDKTKFYYKYGTLDDQSSWTKKDFKNADELPTNDVDKKMYKISDTSDVNGKSVIFIVEYTLSQNSNYVFVDDVDWETKSWDQRQDISSTIMIGESEKINYQ